MRYPRPLTRGLLLRRYMINLNSEITRNKQFVYRINIIENTMNLVKNTSGIPLTTTTLLRQSSFMLILYKLWESTIPSTGRKKSATSNWSWEAQQFTNTLESKSVSALTLSTSYVTHLALAPEIIIKLFPNLAVFAATLLRCPRIIIARGLQRGQLLLTLYHPRFRQLPIRKVHKFSLRYDLFGILLLMVFT